MSSHSRQVEYAAIAAVLLVAVAMRFFTLGSADIWHDEYFTAVFYHERAWIPENFLIYVLILLSQTLLGENEFALRLPSVLFGIAGIYVVYRLGKEMHSPAAGIVAAAILTLLPWHLFHSQYARYYAAIVFFTALMHLFLFRALRQDSITCMFATGVAALLSVFTHLTGVVAPVTLWIVCAAIYFLPRTVAPDLSRRIVGLVFWSGVATVILALPILYSKFVSWTTTPGQFSRSPAQQIFQYYTETGVVILLAAYALITGRDSISKFLRIHLGVTLFFPIGLAIVGTLFTSIRGDYAICFVVPAVIAASIGLISVWRNELHGRVLAALLACLLLADAAPRLLSHYTDRLANTAQDAAAFLVNRMRPGDRVASFEPGVRFYLERASIDVERDGIASPYADRQRWPNIPVGVADERLWLVFRVTRDDISSVARSWLLENKATVAWRKVTPRVDSQVRGVEIFLVCPPETNDC